MHIDKKIIKEMAEDRQHQDYRLEKILLNFAADICANMEALGINRTELATRLGKSRSFVSKVMSCNHNVTLKTMDSISHALGMELAVKVQEMRGVAEELAIKMDVIPCLENAGYEVSKSRVLANKYLPFIIEEEEDDYDYKNVANA